MQTACSVYNISIVKQRKQTGFLLVVSDSCSPPTFSADVFQEECLFGWMGHEWEVYNVQFSSDETSVYSMGMDGKFSQWSVMKSGEKVGR